MAITVKEIADEVGETVTNVKNFLRSSGFGGGGRDFRGAETSLTREEVQAVRDAAARGELRRDRTSLHDVGKRKERPDPKVSADDLSSLPPVLLDTVRLAPQGRAAHRLFVHLDTLEWLGNTKTAEPLRRAFTRRAQELMAHGRATRTKGVRGANAGWLRIPLGGNSGSHFYLWLLNHGESIARQETDEFYSRFPRQSRILRAVRHHDETKSRETLSIDTAEEYVEIQATALLFAQEDGLAEPLVSAQQRIVSDAARVRCLLGQPGAGKTTSLQAATQTLRGRALYLTWSEHLAERAKQWFAAYAPAELEVVVWTFNEFLSHVDPSRSARAPLPLARTVELLKERLAPLGHQLGPWWSDGGLRAEELYAELHAHVFGAALPVAFRGRRACRDPQLRSDDYTQLRSGLGKKATRAVALAVSKLSDEDIGNLFASPLASFERATALQLGELELDNEVFAFDWVLVDEVQDLTLSEQWLLVDVAARSGRFAGVRPGVIIAGDEAQTVRPTSFEWGSLKDLLAGRLGAASTDRSEHELTANLRSPHDVAAVINRARRVLYSQVDKRQRPRGRVAESPADATVGRILQVELEDQDGLASVLRMFSETQGDAALVYPGALVPDQIAAPAREAGVVVWTSETAKGLEFRVVGILDVPQQIANISALAEATVDEPLAAELARTAIDRFLVALSRTAETLVLFAPRWDRQAQNLVRPLLEEDEDVSNDDAEEMEGSMGVVARSELAEFLLVDAADVRERIDALIHQSEQLSSQGEAAPAARLAKNAVGLLGRRDRPGSAGAELRKRAHRRLGQALAVLALQEGSREELGRAAHQFRMAERRQIGDVLRSVGRALSGDLEVLDTQKALRGSADALTTTVPELEPLLVQPLLGILRARLERVVERGPLPSTPKGRETLLATAKHLARSAPSDRAEFGRTHDSLLLAILTELARVPQATTEYEQLRRGADKLPGIILLDGYHAEARGDLAEAARFYEAANEPGDALRCLRANGDLAEAMRVASDLGHADAKVLGWAQELRSLLDSRPDGRFTLSERALLVAEFEDAFREPSPPAHEPDRNVETLARAEDAAAEAE